MAIKAPVILVLCSASLLAADSTPVTQPAASSPQAIPLFNGKDLTGWDGAPGWWTVEDGALTAQSTPQNVCNAPNYLIWTGGKPSDFELTCDFKISAAGNSGIQIRSEVRPNWDTFGYQCQITDSRVDAAHRSGVIALQMHPGPPMKVQFKNILLKELKAP